MNFPLVTVQIPTYNQKHYIKEAIDSVCSQSYNNVEIIVSDDCSPYDINEYLKDFVCKQNFKLIANKVNLGRVKNYRNTLYNHVKGKYFVNLDGDDYFIDSSFLEYAVNILEEYEKNYKPVVFEYNHNVQKIKDIVGEYIVIDENSILIDGIRYFQNLHKINEFTHASCIFKTETAKSIGFYSIDSLCSDFDSACRILLEGSIIVSSAKVAEWRIHENNASWSLNTEQYFSEKKSIKNIIDSAKGKVKPVDLLPLEKALNFGLYYKTLSLFENDKNYKEQIKFILFNSKVNFLYFKAIARFMINKMVK
ncbi:glycosyltransferase family 2 protein [Flavobacterium commune]|uniref:Glycosyltransferase 2-like domain-containing protein n=1 Tax=Flavobacterium commune TaxID=1306519 RepID=A0A1D9P7H2_9FLAO|nr:glycosyltransferase [Flavobacterium commune]AOZ98547.1 hypothetical protein BIW12_03360 [Flavobacterium commune]